MPKQAWKGKTAVVCGASAGLGQSLAFKLAASGVSKLALIARKPAALEALQGEISRRYPDVRLVADPVDMCETKAVAASAERIQSELGEVDLLIQAVGQSDRGTISQLDSNRLHQLFDANVTSSLNAILGFEAHLSRPGGTIVLIGSLASLFAPRFLGGYSITKHALAGLAQQSRLELEERGLHVMLACPGPIARSDAGVRYREQENVGQFPEAALQPGGGAKIRGLDPDRLARDILKAAAKHKRVIIRPQSARLLQILAAISPRLGDYLLQRMSS